MTLIPVFFLNSLTGSFFKPLAATYALAVHGVARGRADQHAGAQPDPVLTGQGRAPRVTARQAPATRLRPRDHLAGREPAGCRPTSTLGALAVLGVGDRAAARPGAVPGVQGAGLPDALAVQAGDIAPGGAAHRHPGKPGAARRSPACATSARTSARHCSARRPRASTSARTGSASIRTPTTTRRGRSSTRSSPATRGCSPTSRPTSPSGSAR